jgi:hypothetical protein
MARFDSMIAMTKRLIEKNGQTVTWRQITNGTPPDQDKPWKPAASVNADNPVKMVFLPSDRENREFIQYLTGTTVKTGDLLAYMGQVSFAPSAKDVIVRGNVEYVVETIDLVEPNDEGVILYIIELGAGGAGI